MSRRLTSIVIYRGRLSAVTKISISADSHITEPPNCYIDHIDPSYRDR
ncbi:uncharacterized protein METZ01_LOCUS283177, partial [marine metagenome]